MLWDIVAKTSKHIIERQQCWAPKFDDHRFYRSCKHGADGNAPPHQNIGGVCPCPQFGHSDSVQAAAFGQGTARVFRR
jgi:hypothetical protein